MADAWLAPQRDADGDLAQDAKRRSAMPMAPGRSPIGPEPSWATRDVSRGIDCLDRSPSLLGSQAHAGELRPGKPVVATAGPVAERVGRVLEEG